MMDNVFSGEAKKKRLPTKKWSEGEIAAELQRFQDKIKDCKENQGEIEVRDTVLEKAEFYKYEVLDFVEAEKVFREANALTGPASKKMEILFEILLMNIEKEDIGSVKKDID